MPNKKVKSLIIAALEDLEERDLKKFKRILCDRKEEPCVSRRSVESADEMDLADLLVKVFTEKKSVEVTVGIFKELGFNDEAEKLAKAAGLGEDSLSPDTGGDEHFIDMHRSALISRVSCVDAILDHLLDKKVIVQEIYTDIRSQDTSYKKMRKLMELGSISSSAKGKQILYEALLEKEPCIMEDLINSQNA
ncbi:hypothetical protein ACEWY4_020003 [Coilia grayii]|uniref:Apoptosis-associated speck-like protein containing a CARD n=1 Tax=Coilia grayii TaxID=363190 RepID=A0ABD1JBD0_9TELE